MYDNNVLYAETLIASGAVLGNRFVTYAGAQAGAGDHVCGVAAYDAATGEAFSANVAGRLSVEAGAPITVGQRVKSDTAGRAIPAADADEAAGRAIKAVSGAGFPVRILRFQS
jgi:hypothetical protein